MARALAACVDEDIEAAAISQMRVQTHPGCGLEANFVDCCGQSRRLRAGTPQWIDPNPADYQQLHARLRAGYGDPIAVETDGDLVAVCLIRERVRPSAQQAWSGCRQLGMKVTVLTGDRVERAIAAGFDNAYGKLSPLDRGSLHYAVGR